MMFPFSLTLSEPLTAAKLLELMLETDRRTVAFIVLATALVIYNVRSYLANPSMCTFIAPMIVAVSIAIYQLLILLEIAIPNQFNNWLISCIASIGIGASISVLLSALLGQIVEVFARMRVRKDMPAFEESGPNKSATPTLGAGQPS